MSKKEDVRESRDKRKAAMLAVHLVSQVLDEANVIANAAEESGQPWRYLSTLRNMRSGKLGDVEEDGSFVTTNCDCDGGTDNNEELNNVIATSTPEKLIDNSAKLKNETSIIGQGDEDSIAWQSDMSNSTSMFISHLFDMSDVGRVVVCDCAEAEADAPDPNPNSLITQAMSKIMESYINMAFNLASVAEAQMIEPHVAEKSSKSTDNSCYSFLADAFVSDVRGDIAFYIDEDVATANVADMIATEEVAKIIEIVEEVEVAGGDYKIERSDIDLCENAYLTLNRDYEQYSEEEADVMPEDTKAMTFQDVVLIDDSISESTAQEENVEEGRSHGSIRGICPLSPAARRRASSLLDNRSLYSPTSQRPVMWKYNTLNEAVVNSSRWKDYAFDMKPDECDEAQTFV